MNSEIEMQEIYDALTSIAKRRFSHGTRTVVMRFAFFMRSYLPSQLGTALFVRAHNFESQKIVSEADELCQGFYGLSSKVLIFSIIVYIVQAHFMCLQSNCMKRGKERGKGKG